MADSTEPRRYLIAIGSPHCANIIPGELNQVKPDIKKVTELFEKQGYERVLSEIGTGKTSARIKGAVAGWFSSAERRSSDCVVVYYAGHGDERFGKHYLYTVESDQDELLTTAISTEDFARSFFQANQSQSPQNILLILDVCFANDGGQQIVEAVSRLQGDGRRESSLYLIASARSKDLAGDGAFVEALYMVMNSAHEKFINYGEFVPIGSLTKLINKQIKNGQQAIWHCLNGGGEAVFFKNPSRPIASGGSSLQEVQGRGQLSSQLIQCLWSLDYEQQSQVFRNRISESRVMGAFVIQAKDALIQEWLVRRLFQERLDIGNPRVRSSKVPQSQYKLPEWIKETLWRDLNAPSALPDLADQKTAVLQELETHYCTKDVVIVIYGWQDLEEFKVMRERVLEELWKPLVARVQNLSSKKRLILLFTEDRTEDPKDSDDVNEPSRLASPKITKETVKQWLWTPNVRGALVKCTDESKVEDVIEYFENKDLRWDEDPRRAIDKIFELFDLDHDISVARQEWRLVG